MQGWGLTVALGIHPTPRMLPLHPMELFDGRRITGCVFGDFKGKSQLPLLVDQCINGVRKALIPPSMHGMKILRFERVLNSELSDELISQEVKINFDGFITHEMPFSEINEAFRLLEEGKSLRCVLRL